MDSEFARLSPASFNLSLGKPGICVTSMPCGGVPFPSSASGVENITISRGDKRTRRNALMDGQSAPQTQPCYRSR